MPAVRQAVAVHATRTIKKTGATSTFQRLFITSLTAQEAGPTRLLQLIRSHWVLRMGCIIDAMKRYGKIGVI